jgi:uncharacterized damage-inducible protein DinB
MGADNAKYRTMIREPRQTIDLLRRTPALLRHLLQGLSLEQLTANEGEGSWSPLEVVAHLLVCEQSNFMSRIELLLSEEASKPFVPIDMTAHFSLVREKSLEALLNELEELRAANLDRLASANLKEEDLARTGLHPTLGSVSLGQVLSTWAAHDLSHQAQILRILAGQYREGVGPFITYLRILR